MLAPLMTSRAWLWARTITLVVVGACAGLPRGLRSRPRPDALQRIDQGGIPPQKVGRDGARGSSKAEPAPKGSGETELTPLESGEAEPAPKGLVEMKPAPLGSGEAEPMPKGSDEVMVTPLTIWVR
jgi:hypothetical protein